MGEFTAVMQKVVGEAPILKIEKKFSAADQLLSLVAKLQPPSFGKRHILDAEKLKTG